MLFLKQQIIDRVESKILGYKRKQTLQRIYEGGPFWLKKGVARSSAKTEKSWKRPENHPLSIQFLGECAILVAFYRHFAFSKKTKCYRNNQFFASSTNPVVFVLCVCGHVERRKGKAAFAARLSCSHDRGGPVTSI